MGDQRDVELERILVENQFLKHKLNKYEDKTKILREQIQMLNEELIICQADKMDKVCQLQLKIQDISSQLQHMFQVISAAQLEKIKLKQFIDELEQFKTLKKNLACELKNLSEENNQPYKKTLEYCEELMSLQHLINQKAQIREKQVIEIIINEKLKHLPHSPSFSLFTLENFKQKMWFLDFAIKLIEAENEVVYLKSEESKLKLRIQEKDENFKEALMDMEKRYKEIINRMKDENTSKMNQFVNQCDETITKLQMERELLLAQLVTDKKNSEYKKKIFQQCQTTAKDEILTLKSVLSEKQKEVSRLAKNNEELKKLWNESASLLKSINREPQSRPQQSTKRRKNLP